MAKRAASKSKPPAAWPMITAVALAISGVACQRDAGAAPTSGALARADRVSVSAAVPEAIDREAALRTLATRRAALRASFRAARGEARGAARKDAARTLEQALVGSVLPRWDGTAWSFSGTSRVPGTGSIACGYFVSTTLEEAGLGVERARLAQQPAEDIIKTLVPAAAIARFSNVPVEDFTAAVARRGDGLYIVGLDVHVGFLVVKSGDVLFHHASYVPPRRVVCEAALTSTPIVTSRYRVIGKLFTDDALIEAWLSGAPIPTKVRL